MGYGFIEMRGGYKEEDGGIVNELSLFVPGIDKRALVDLGSDLDQDSVIYKDKNSFEKIETIECDCICVSGFWTPSVHLASHSGNKLKYEEKIDAFIPDKKKQHETSVGAANGSFTLEESLKAYEEQEKYE